MRITIDEYYLSLLPGIAARGTCLRRQVGAIIVDDRYRILGTGFNGVPRGFPHCAELTSEQTIKTRENMSVMCEGFKDPKGDTRRCMAVHAEINALINCFDLERGFAMYISCTPCKTCALAIANTNIARVLCLEAYADDSRYILEAAQISVIIPKSV